MSDFTIIVKNDSLYLADSDLQAAVALAHHDRDVRTSTRQTDDGTAQYVVELWEADGGGIAEFGNAPEYNEAWRYALGAFLGSWDEAGTGVADTLAAIDNAVTDYQHERVSAERALSNIAAILADSESGTDV